MGLSNDERGWVMTSLSGVACVLGASVICVDIIVRQFPGKQNFRIQDSDSFLSASLSLSFGVMLFSSLFSMLPSSKSSLMDSGYDPKTATWIMMACFLGGVAGIQVLSRALHAFIPSHVVDCEHTHADEDNDNAKEHAQNEDHEPHSPAQASKPRKSRPRARTKSSLPGHLPQAPLPTSKGNQPSYFSPAQANDFASSTEGEARQSLLHESSMAAQEQDMARPPFHKRITSRLTRLASARPDECGEDGPCRGFSGICADECFRNLKARASSKASARSAMNGSAVGTVRRYSNAPAADEDTPLLAASNGNLHHHDPESSTHNYDDDHDIHDHEHDDGVHHHHVPNNAFLSIGLQTSIAIALHKLPEGFITYATNHANPQLGVAVFLALFIHNITEGFAMALPLYLAINSRLKAMFWSFVLGGLSQPLGAAIAAVWFAVAGNGKWAPSEAVYGAMFAATAGIMVSVALQLFSEALDLTHNRTLCMVGAISGMCILGVSSALTAK